MGKQVVAVALVMLTSGFAATGYAQEMDREILLRHYQVPMFVQLSGQIYLLELANVESKEEQYEKPPLSKGRIAGEILAGGAVGAVLALGGGLACGAIGREIGHAISDSSGKNESGLCAGWFDAECKGFFIGIIVGVTLGYVLGTATGVYLIGNIGNETGSFSRALLGTIAGGCVPVPFLGSAIGATFMFNTTRRYKSPPAESETALINIRDGQMNLAVPVPYLRPDSFSSKSLNQRVDLLRVRF